MATTARKTIRKRPVSAYDTCKTVTVRIAAPVLAAAQKRAKGEDTTISRIVRKALGYYAGGGK